MQFCSHLSFFALKGKSSGDFFKAADVDGSACITFEEVINWFRSNPPAISAKGDAATYAHKALLEATAVKMSVKGVVGGQGFPKMFAEAAGGNGCVTMEEWVKWSQN